MSKARRAKIPARERSYPTRFASLKPPTSGETYLFDIDSKKMTPGSPAGAGDAPVGASYVLIALDPTLTQERTLAGTSPITLTDGGAGLNAAIGIPNATSSVTGAATSTQITKLDGIETSADVTDAANVNAAGAVMEGDTAGGDLGGTYPNPTVDDGADSTAIHDNVAGEIVAVTEKATPVANDEVIVEDSADSNNKKSLKVGNIDHDTLSAGTVAAHDTTATGAELDTLTDGSDADTLHDHTNHGVTHNAAHGISKHTEHANWKLFHSDGSGDEQEVALGADGQVLKGTGASSAPAFEDDFFVIPFVIDGGGAVIGTGQHGHTEVPCAGTITECRLLADQDGAIKVDIWKSTYADYDPDGGTPHPADGDTITGANEPEIAASGNKDTDSTLTNWTTSLTAEDILAFNVDSIATIERCTVVLKVKKT